jgi:hypothetical protein
VNLVTPLGLLGLLFVPAVVVMYLLKLRRDEAVVPSTLLWQRLVADVEANAPWQRLRRSLLLLLQLLLVVILALLAARPFLERPAGLAGDLVLVVDTSASMAAKDVVPDRLTAAKRLAIEALRDLPSGGRVSVIAAGSTARVVVNGTSDLGRVRAAIDGLAVSPAVGDLGDALALADALAARSLDAEVLVATDAALAVEPTTRLDHPVKVLHVGRERANQAIVALAVRTAPSGVTRSVFISVANLDIEQATRRVELYGDGVLLEARDLFMDPQTRTEVIVDDVPGEVTAIEVRLDGDSADDLALDDRAWAIVPPERLRRILLVSDGDPYLETALTYLPNTELYGVSPARYGPDTHPELFDLIIFEGRLPALLPDTAILAIAPDRTSPLGEVTGTLTDPGIGTLSVDEPILRYVDLSTVHIGKATKLVLPDWARPVIPGPKGAPLLYAGLRDGLPTAVMAFATQASDLPLQVAFPILMANLAGELLGGSAGPAEPIGPGEAVGLPIPSGASGLTVTRPDGSTVDLAPGITGATTISFSQTDQLGIYTVVARFPDATPQPSAEPSPSPGGTASPAASASQGGSASPVPTAPPVDPGAPFRFAVDLFSAAESDIAPGSPSSIAALGRDPSASPTPAQSPDPSASADPSASPAGGGGATEPAPRPPARDELWVPIVLAVLVLLMAEWLVYQRDAVTRLWRGLRSRLRGGPAAGEPTRRTTPETTREATR